MDYEQFKKEWKDEMVYKVDYENLEQDINVAYTFYKEDPMRDKTVKAWCEFFYWGFDFDTHPYMSKTRAINSRHGDALSRLARGESRN